MMRFFRLCLLLFAFFGMNAAQAQQGECGTALPDSAHLALLEHMVASGLRIHTELDSMTKVPMKIHVVEESNGKSFSLESIMTAVCELNNKYRPVRIQFYLIPDIEYIPWGPGLNPLGGYSDGSTLMNMYNQDSVVNVYFTALGSIGLCGYAFYPGSGPGPSFAAQGGLMMGTNCSGPGNTTFAHEMGHYLSLPHPFDRTSNNVLDPNNAELVTRNPNEPLPRRSANCATAGDRFCDTPTDFINTRWSCNVPVALKTDLNGDTLRPDPTLYMSYSLDVCSNRFSQQQTAAMQNTIQNVRTYLHRSFHPNTDTLVGQVQPELPVDQDSTVACNYAYFQWKSIPGAAGYLLQVSRSPNFNITSLDTMVTDTFLATFSIRLNPFVKYQWRVRAFSWNNPCSTFGQPSTFRAALPIGTGVAESQDASILVYPSLAQNGDVITVQSKTFEQLQSLQLLDLNGKVANVSSVVFQGSKANFTLEGLASGMYWLRMFTEKGVQYSRIVVR